MPSGIEVARAYVTIIPKSDGTSTDVINSIVNPLNDSVGDAGTKAGGLFNMNLGKVLGKFAMPAAVGTALIGLGKIGADMYAEVEAGTMNVIKATGATGDAAKELEGVYKNVAQNVVGDFGDIGAAVGEVTTRFGVSGDELQGLSEQYMKFSKVNGTDVVKSIDQTQKALSAFGLDASDAAGLLDAMTVAGQNTGVSMETLQNGLIQNAAALQEMGMDIGQSVDFMAQLETSGANSETVMNGLRKALKNAAEDGIPLDQALSDLQNTIENGADGVDGLTAAYDLFGKSGDQIYNAVKNGSLSFEDLAKSAQDSSGALDSVYNDTLTNSEKMDLAMQNIKIAGADLFAPVAASISDVLTNFIVPFAQEATDKIGAFMESVTTFYDENIAPVVEDVSAVVLPIVTDVVSKVEDGIGAIGDVVQEVMPYIQSTVQTVWPIVQNVILTATSVIRTYVVPVFQTIGSIIGTVMNGIQRVVQTVWPIISRIISTAVGIIKTVIGSISSVIGKVQTTFQNVKKYMTEPIESAKKTIKGAIEKIKGLFPISIGKIMSNIKTPTIDVDWAEKTFMGQTIKYPAGFRVGWKAKGGIFDGPSIIGVGEAGREAVVPLEGKYMRPFAEAIASELGKAGGQQTNIFNVTIDGATAGDPEAFADELVRQLKIKVRTA